MGAEPQLIIVGDSFAEGRGDPDGNGGFVGWVPRMARLLGIPAEAVLNLGAYNATTQDVVDQQLSKIADLDAALVGVAVGGNDLMRRAYDRERMRANLRTILEAVTGQPGRTVFTHDYPDIPGKLPGIPDETREVLRGRFAESNAYIAKLCEEFGVARYELSTAELTRDPEMWYPDGIHPSAAGHRAIAVEMLAVVTAAHV
jgi:lysophospholipase L1-like esterase